MNEEMIMKHTYNGRYLPVQELVRCRDCKFYHEDDYGYCEFWGDVFHHWEGHDKADPNGFCHMGERKEDDKH